MKLFGDTQWPKGQGATSQTSVVISSRIPIWVRFLNPDLHPGISLRDVASSRIVFIVVVRWQRCIRRRRLRSLVAAGSCCCRCCDAGESVDDCGGGYSESIAEMCDELQNGSVAILIQTPNGRDESGSNRDCFLLNPSLKSPLHQNMFRFFGQSPAGTGTS